MADRRAQQLVDLQNRITELNEQGRLDLLTSGEVALISYALGRYHGELTQDDAATERKRGGGKRNG